MKRKLERVDLQRMNLPEAYWTATIKKVPESVVKPVYRFLRRFDQMATRGAGLILLGKSGVGKTAIAALVAKEARSRGRTVYFTSVWELRDGLKSYAQFDGEQSLMDRARGVDVLVLDDVRPADLEKGMYGRAEIEALVSSRCSRRKVTIITSQTTNSRGAFAEFERSMPTLVRATEDSLVPLVVDGPNLRDAALDELHALVMGDGK